MTDEHVAVEAHDGQSHERSHTGQCTQVADHPAQARHSLEHPPSHCLGFDTQAHRCGTRAYRERMIEETGAV